MNLLETLQYTNGGKIQKIGKNKDSIEMDESEFPVIRNEDDYNQLKKEVITVEKKKKKKQNKKKKSRKKRNHQPKMTIVGGTGKIVKEKIKDF